MKSVFGLGNILGYGFFGVIMIGFVMWFVRWMKKIGGGKKR